MIWATISSRSCFCWLNRASPSSAAKNIISLISVLTIWWCPCVELSLWYHSPSLCPTTNAEDAEVEQFYEDLQYLLELTPKKDGCLFFFHYRWLECKSRKSRDTSSSRKIWPWNTEWSRAKANRVLPRECTDHSKHPLPTTQETATHGHHQMVNTEIRLIIFFAVEDGKALYSQQKQDLELTVA